MNLSYLLTHAKDRRLSEPSGISESAPPTSASGPFSLSLFDDFSKALFEYARNPSHDNHTILADTGAQVMSWQDRIVPLAEDLQATGDSGNITQAQKYMDRLKGHLEDIGTCASKLPSDVSFAKSKS